MRSTLLGPLRALQRPHVRRLCGGFVCHLSLLCGFFVGGSALAAQDKARTSQRRGCTGACLTRGLPGPHAFDIVGGGSQPFVWGLRLQGGYPWQAIQVQLGLPGGWTPLLEFDTALFRRNQPSVGLGLRWIDTPHFRLTGEVLLGWQIQLGEIRQQGPSAALRLRALYRWSRVALFLRLDTRHTLLFDQEVIDTREGLQRRTSLQHRWSPWASLGIAIRLIANVSLDLEVAWPWVDAPTISIPGVHLGLHFALPRLF